MESMKMKGKKSHTMINLLGGKPVWDYKVLAHNNIFVTAKKDATLTNSLILELLKRLK